jgi:hypothetical protein
VPDIPLASEVVREMKAKPYTMLVIIGLSTAVPWMWLHDARADDVQQLSAQVTQINVGLLEAKLERIEAQLFDIEAKIADKAAAHESVDAIYTDKLKELSAEKAHTERVLATLNK